jgi:hypothetical protein
VPDGIIFLGCYEPPPVSGASTTLKVAFGMSTIWWAESMSDLLSGLRPSIFNPQNGDSKSGPTIAVHKRADATSPLALQTISSS